MNQDVIEKIKSKVEKEFEDGGFKLSESHFENGRNLHGEQYYFAKRYFQNTDNCKEIAEMLCAKLKDLSFPESTTLVGFRNYSGLLLNEAIKLIGKYNYEIIEQSKDSFIWQHQPKLKDNLVIILPMSCTYETYIKLRKFLIDFCKDKIQLEVNTNFISVFSILEESLKAKQSETIKINELKGSDFDLYKIYSAFNWTEIGKDKILLNNKTPTTFTAHPLVRLYSKMFLPENCPLCFPGKSIEEKPLFLTHDNYETPNLIFGFPNFSKAPQQQNFFETFCTDGKVCNVHLRGHIRIDDSSYSSYIRGNAFYEKNKDKILQFFNEKLSEHLKPEDKNIIFITAGNKHNSKFLEDISLSASLKDRSVTILQYQHSKEFVDNFISLHRKEIEINERRVKVFYFEDVMSAGKTFKLVSNYIKHARDNEHKKIGIHGVDLVLTLVDRTPSYTKDEIIKKLFSKTNHIKPEDHFISFFRLNVPIISASHLGNPLTRKIENLEKVIEQCHLDSLKMTIAKEISKRQPISLPELDSINEDKSILRYFPFGDIDRKIDKELYQLYKPHFTRNHIDLLRLYLAHKLNSELSETEYIKKDFENEPGKFIKKLIEKIEFEVKDKIADYFIPSENHNSTFREIEVEKEIVRDIIVKILSQRPFIYYKNIYEPIFHYCITELDKIYTQVEGEGIKSFKVFRKLKFYIRRSIDLNSNFIVSERFIQCIKQQYNKKGFDKIIKYHKDSITNLDKLKDNIDDDYFQSATNNAKYKLDQLASFFPQLLSYYKELICKNPSISIKLEELINSDSLLPKEISVPNNLNNKLEELIADPYFHFTGMVKAENINLFNELKELHKENIKNQAGIAESERKPNFSAYRGIRRYYFKSQKHDPIIVIAQKLLEKSRHHQDRLSYQHIKTAISNMLLTVSILENKKRKQVDSSKTEKRNLNEEIKEILDSVMKIIEPGIPEGSLKYVFFVEFKKRTKDNTESDNIYSIASDETSNNPSNIKLDKNGLMYNMLYGLYDDSETKNEQTLIAGAKSKKGKFISFKKDYYLLDEKKTVDFADLCEYDFFDSDTRKGVNFSDKNGKRTKSLNEENMFLAVRFANILKLANTKDKYKFEGRAILLITNSQEGNTANFLNFMSNEKIRLLLLIKEELLNYLQKQFVNDAFIDVLENRKTFIYQRHLRHGLGDYLKYQIEIAKNILDGDNANENYKIIKIITEAIAGQIGATKINDVTKRKKINKQDFIKKLQLIMESKYFGKKTISMAELKLSGLNFEKIELHPSLYDVIIPELLINMKKYSPVSGLKGICIEYDSDAKCFHFKNFIALDLPIDDGDSGEGIKMCNGILNTLKLEILVPTIDHENNVYSVTLGV